MTAITNKLEEVHIDFWGPYNPPSKSESTYTGILMYKHIWKTWTISLQGKNNFIDAF